MNSDIIKDLNDEKKRSKKKSKSKMRTSQFKYVKSGT